MSLRPCPREVELSVVLKAGHWPDACDSRLREHVSTCQRCRELVLLTQTFKAARAEAVVLGDLPHPGLLWWRAQLRRRNEALERLSQPTRIVGRFALLSALVVTLGFLIWQRHSISGWLDGLGGVSHPSSFRLDALWSATSNWNVLLLAGCIAALAFFGAVALYFSSDKH
jgi:hypothetical protein